jgi:di/tricarboxylate transporter
MAPLILIACLVGVALTGIWWLFDSALPGSRRSSFDTRGRAWAERRLAQPHRLSYRFWLASVIVVVVLLVWLLLEGQ